MNNSMWGFIGIFVLCCGIYALYSFVIMKVKGEINASILLGKDYTYKKCKDKEAYIAKTAPALFCLWTGICDLWSDRCDSLLCSYNDNSRYSCNDYFPYCIDLVRCLYKKSQKQILLKMSVPFLFADRNVKSTYLQL